MTAVLVAMLALAGVGLGWYAHGESAGMDERAETVRAQRRADHYQQQLELAEQDLAAALARANYWEAEKP